LQPRKTEHAEQRLGEIIGGKWTLQRVLGTGATSTVYAARDEGGSCAAVKILNAEMGSRPDIRERFVQERRATALIEHPGVVRVLELDATDPENTYLAMELLDGETVAERVRRTGAPSPAELLDWADQVLDVLVTAHAQGVVHRDLKPGNLFLTASGRLKLLDFGIARVVDPKDRPTGTQAGVMLGTAAYMSPEQARGRSQDVDGRSDLFALGAVMFRLATGRRVHLAASDSELLAKMATQPASPVAAVAPTVAPHVGFIIDLALSFSKEARYPDARTMQADVRAVSAGGPPPHATQALGSSERTTVYGDVPSDPVPVPASTFDAVAGPSSLEGQIVADRYHIEKLLGSGGMGSVYRAVHVHMRKAVAVKVLHREMTAVPEVVARFEREAVAAGRIEHPNVVAATDFGQLPDGSFYLILEFVEGQSLRAALDSGGAMPVARALHIACQIVAALGAAHAAGIVHRDLKPDNVMLVLGKDDPDFVKVLDFGIAKLSAEDTAGQPALTQLGSVFGTPEYMSPEQAKGEAVDARSDLYSAGVLLYEMLAGRSPFAHDEMIAVLTAQMTQAPPPLPPHIPPLVAELVMTQLAKDPAERLQTAEELLARLDALGATAASAPLAAQSLDPAVVAEIGTSPTVLGIPASPDTPLSCAAAVVATAASAEPPSAVAQLPIGPPSALGPTHRLRPSPANLAWIGREFEVAGRHIPVWVLFVGALGVGLVGTLLVLLLALSNSRGPTAETAIAAAVDREANALSAPADPAAAKLIERARTGDQTALKELQAKPEDERSLRDWLALGRGHAVLAEHSASIASYGHALKRDPSVSRDPDLLRDVREAMLDPTSSKAAFALCRNSLGSAGPDLLYDVWWEHRSRGAKNTVLAEAKKALDDETVRAKSSPALSIALALSRARGCQAHKQLLPRAARAADGRSAPYLRRLLATKGCGFLGLGDCYSCVRGDRNLTAALERAKQDPGPDFSQAADAAPNR